MAKQKGVVAGGHLKTVEAGAEILKDGGNAIEAMIAALMASTVAEPVFAHLVAAALRWCEGAAAMCVFMIFSARPLDEA